MPVLVLNSTSQRTRRLRACTHVATQGCSDCSGPLFWRVRGRGFLELSWVTGSTVPLLLHGWWPPSPPNHDGCEGLPDNGHSLVLSTFLSKCPYCRRYVRFAVNLFENPELFHCPWCLTTYDP